MHFLKDLNTFHIDGKEIPCIVASGPPDHRYCGAPGVLYMDRDTGRLYICIDADTLERKYVWRIVSDVDAASVQQAVEAYIKENPVLSGGLSSSAAALLVSILENAVFTSDQSDSITALAEALAVDGEEEPDTPQEPDNSDAVTYTVTNNLTNVTNSNAAASVTEGASYAATLTAADGYTLDGGTVTVTMGGVDITSTVYLNGEIDIATVSGNLVITAVAVGDATDENVPLVRNNTIDTDIKKDSITAYSDEGETALELLIVDCFYVSEEVFSEDTPVVVTRPAIISDLGTWSTFMIGECDGDDLRTIYNATFHDHTTTSSAVAKDFEYTVHAGRRLYVGIYGHIIWTLGGVITATK